MAQDSARWIRGSRDRHAYRRHRFLLGGSSAFGAAPPTDIAAVAYTYDGPAYDAPGTDSASERSPPVEGETLTTYDAVSSGLQGTLERPEGLKAPSTTTYAYPGTLAQAAPATTTTGSAAGALRGDLGSLRGGHVAAKTATGAENAISGALLRNHLRQLEKYGQGGFRELESGRFRYFGNLTPAAKQGEMAGRRLVREWDPGTGATRTCYETIDRSGNIRIVRPETGGPKTHYSFDEFGNFGGAW